MTRTLSTPRRISAAAAAAGACFLSAAALIAAAVPAQAVGNDYGYGVSSGGNRLIIFNTNTPNAASQGTPITGLGAGETIAAIDFRPATGVLYALTDDSTGTGRLYTVNTANAVASAVAPGVTYALGDTVNNQHYDIDFNPTVDRIRVVGTNGYNFRINPNNGAQVGINTSTGRDTDLTYPASGDAGSSTVPPGVGGAAYDTNSSTATSTTLFDADFITNSLVRQGAAGVTSTSPATDSPNAGNLTTIGAFGPDIASLLGFDISGTTGVAYLAAQTQNSRGVTSSATKLYTVNLGTGAATPVASDPTVGGTANADLLQTFAIGPNPNPNTALPEFGAPALAAGAAFSAGAAVFVLRRRKTSASL